ncbi:helix-turn-helix domain-containing protein [Acidovorax sp. LjRoot118]|uniref:YdaS family helix-turn-helix protein n=1 Tax=Acidovorax sp. LjRoot118 TaxID=3342256 RepID=UPI003ED0F060
MESTNLARPRPSTEAATQAVVKLGGPVRAAKLLGADRYQRVQSWMANGVPVEFCARLERLLQGALTRRDFYPHDWPDIWPELVEEGAANDPATALAQRQEVAHA